MQNGIQGLSGEMIGELHYGKQGAKGDPFTYDDFTDEQLAALKGEPGKTPVKGTDYWTDTDKQEMVDDVVNSEAFVKLQNEVNKIREDMNYFPIDITSISDNVGTVEMGTTVSELSVTWQLNKDPASQTLDGEQLGVDVRSKVINIAGKTSVTLTVTDERGATDSANAGYSIYNGIYYGAAANPTTVDSAFIRSLSRELSGSKGRTITVNAGANQRIWYALPARLGACSFSVGGFTGGFDLVDTISYTNASGYTESYNVYASAKTGLGETKVVVS